MAGSRFWTMMLITGLPFGAVMGLYFFLRGGDSSGSLVGGLATGLFFGAALAAFAALQRRRLAIRDGQCEGESVLHQGPANHWMGAEARGGWLILTPRRLLFRSHGKNLRNPQVEIPLDEIASLRPVRTLGIVPNGLEIARRDGRKEKLVLGQRAGWIAAIDGASARRSSPP